MIRKAKSLFHKLTGRSSNQTLRLGEAPSFYNVDFAEHVGVGYDSLIVNSTIGVQSYLGPRCIIAHTDIAKFCSIAADVSIGTGGHPLGGNVAMHPAFYLRRPPQWDFVSQDTFDEFKRTAVGSDVWIGTKAVIRDGVSVGDGAVVGAGAIVTKDLEPYGIYAGNPARLLRFRFSDTQIERLLKVRWWDRGPDWIRANIDAFSDIDRFLAEID